MNIKKNITLILFSLLSTVIFAQNNSKLDCENEFEKIETEIESQKTVSYKIIYSQKLYTEDSFEFSEGIIVISDLNDKISTDETIKIIATIGVKNKLCRILAFKSCKAVEFYQKKDKITSEENKYLEENMLPNIEIDLNKLLSKKELKKNKRKRDLIELVSNKTCEDFNNLKTKDISLDKITQILSKNSAEYAEKTMKVYEMSFEESADEFIYDLTNHLFITCESIKVIIKE
jgi:hypothetical protein